MFSHHWIIKKKAEAWIEWTDQTDILRLQERTNFENYSSNTISRNWRVHHARIIVRQMKAITLMCAATKIQSFARERSAHHQYVGIVSAKNCIQAEKNIQCALCVVQSRTVYVGLQTDRRQ